MPRVLALGVGVVGALDVGAPEAEELVGLPDRREDRRLARGRRSPPSERDTRRTRASAIWHATVRIQMSS